ncbi:MAG: peptidylprolyl isomerase [Bacteroidetes bacterium]|nr:MAG: peptidylprolyl isomerase [Bacteroidota bacterium]
MNKAYFLLAFALLILGIYNPIFAQKKKPSAKKDYLVTISTEFGEMRLILFDDTPIHKENFLKLCEEGFYNGATFHRVMKGFMIQGGDPNSKEGGDATQIGRGGPGYTLEAEFRQHHKHQRGALAAARQPDRVNPEKRSSGSQFYIVHKDDGARHLDGSYTVYGQLIAGFEVLDKIAEQQVGRGNRPVKDIRMQVSCELMKKKKISKLYGYTYP